MPSAVVTGAASGVGRACAERLRAEGFDVLAVDINERGLATLDGMRTLTADLALTGERDRVVAEGIGASALVNVAGIVRVKPILEVELSDIRETFALNFEAVWDMSSRIGRTIPQGGAIVNIGSNAAKHPVFVDAAIYAASKAALLSITRSFAYAFAPDVRVNAVSPGPIDTPGREAARAEVTTEPAPVNVPLARLGTPAEVAAAIWFLLSDAAAYMTGQVINVDGGQITW